ncbi:thiol-disulfide oxidoreductase DCC family protein [Rhabdaerophilum sp.]|uniref:thiol-disulfide oxidoreductase DCC family protein n=1 Tax=Rhabdaerophilum sp. TaxID=2717341 RepID=UPI0038D3F610
MSARPVTVWFDSACPICAREIRVMRALDWRGNIAFIDLHAPDAACPIDPALLLARFHARDAGGQLHSGAAAFALMWRHVPLFWPLGQFARIPFMLALLERAYLRFLVWRQAKPARKAAA